MTDVCLLYHSCCNYVDRVELMVGWVPLLEKSVSILEYSLLTSLWSIF